MIISKPDRAIDCSGRRGRPSRRSEAAMVLGMLLVLGTACGGVDDSGIGEPGSATTPVTAVVAADAMVPFGYPAPVQLTATVVGPAGVDPSVTWALDPTSKGCGPLGASVTSDGLFSTPTSPNTYIGGSCTVIAAAVADPSKTDVSNVTITAPGTAQSSPPTPDGAGPATFPGCEGAGCGTVGGRGGAVYRVTSLSDSGVGSLRACVEASGPRTCVFTRGGRINLASELAVRNPYLTIAGQTAQGGGVEVVGQFTGGYVFSVRTHDVVVRYVRFFNGAMCSASSQGCGAVRLLAGARHVVVDHLTTAYTQDQNITIYAADAATAPANVTASWNLNAYPLADHPTGTNISAASTAANESMVDIDFHHNYYANVSHRIFGGGAKRVRWAYNIALNYQHYGLRTGMGVVDDFVGNVYRCGNQSTCTRYPFTLGEYEWNWPAGTPSIYVHNNVWKDVTGRVKVAGDASDASQWSGMVYMVANSSVSADSSTPAPGGYRRATPNAAPSAGKPIAAGAAGPYSGFVVAADGSNLETAVLDSGAVGDAARRTPYGSVGASRRLDCRGNLVNNLDGLLQRAITEYLGGGDPVHAPSGGTPRPASPAAICWTPGECGIPALDAGQECPDADGDGMPDEWEAHWGLRAGTAAGEDGPNGHKLSPDYTNLEMYLNGQQGF